MDKSIKSIYLIIKMGYPLPRSSQENYSKYFQQVVKTGSLTGYKILWVGAALPCRFRSNETKNVLGPNHVFILKKEGKFEYAVIDEAKNMFKLPKKFFTICFPNVSINSIPENNRVEYKITNRKTITLPFIPDAFLEQKKSKTSRKRRKMYHQVDSPPVEKDLETINYDGTNTPSWYVLKSERNNNDMLKKRMIQLIRSIIHLTDSSSFVLKDPFDRVNKIEEIQGNDELLEKLKLITSFIFHYCRVELGIHTLSEDVLKTAEVFVANLNVSRGST